MMKRLLYAMIAIFAVACVDSDKVSWVFVSRTGATTGSGGAVLIIRKTTDAPPTGDTYRLQVEGIDRHGLVTVHLAKLSDTAILDYADRVDISSPMLAPGLTTLDKAVFTPQSGGAGIGIISVTDAHEIDPSAFGLGKLHIAARGSALVLEHQGGLISYSLGDPAVFYPANSKLITSGQHFAITTPEGRTSLVLPGWTPTENQRLERNQGWLRLIGPRGEITATLPEDKVRFGTSGSGIYLTANFPEGVSAEDKTPVELIMAEHNRHLLRVEDR